MLSDGPLAYYRFQEVTGPTARDETSNHNDGTFNSVNCGFRHAGPLQNEDSSRAIQFDGMTCDLSLPKSIGFPAHSPFTFEAWVFVPVMGTANALFGEYQTDPTGLEGYGIFYGTTSNPDSLVASRTVAGIDVIATAVLPGTSNFHHIVYTYDGASIVVYMDATMITMNADARKLNGDGRGIRVGSDGRMAFFSGTIGEVALYPSALPIDRIRAHYKLGTGT